MSRIGVCVARWSSPRYCVGERRAARVEVALDEAVDCMGHLTEQPGDVVVPRRRQRMRPHRAIGAGADARQHHTAALIAGNDDAAGGDLASAKTLAEIAAEDPTLADRVAKLRARLDKPRGAP
jgi:hypothetical protein